MGMNISHAILVTYNNERTYARYATTEEAANDYADVLRTESDIVKVIVEPYLGKTYFPAKEE